MFSFRNCENGHSLVINSHLLNPDMCSVIIGTFNQGNKTHSAGGRFDLICAQLTSRPPMPPDRPPLLPQLGSGAVADRVWVRGGPGARFPKKQRVFTFLPTVLWATFVFYFLLFFSLNHFYKLLKSFSLFSDN